MTGYISKFQYSYIKNISLYQLLFFLKMINLESSLDNIKIDDTFTFDKMFKDLKTTPEEDFGDISKEDTFNIIEKGYDKFSDNMKEMHVSNWRNLDSEKANHFENINFFLYLFSEFENYLFRLQKFILLEHPECMNENQIKLEILLEYSEELNIDTISEVIAEKIVHDIMYTNYSEIFNFINGKKIGLDVTIEKKYLLRLKGFKLIRNIYTHGDGIINTLFHSNIKNLNLKPEDLKISSFSIGDKIEITLGTIFDLINLIDIIMNKFDKDLIEKYPELKVEAYTE